MAPAHTHTPSMILDDDSALFTINPVTREIEYNSEDPLIIMQDDTNSERLTFEIPKIIEGHDMSACRVQIHYINSGATGGQKTGIYEVSDLQVDPNDTTMLRFTWLVSRNATKYDGSLRFSIRCLCTDSSIPAEADPSDILNEDGTVAVGKITYEWSTFPCNDVIRIGSGIRNSTIFEEEEVNDALQSIKAGLVGTYRFIDEHNGVEGSFLELTTSDGEVIVSDNLKCQVRGEQGDIGPAPTIKIGTVKTTDADNPVAKIEVANQNAGEVTLNFVLPQPARDYVTDINGNDMYFFSGTQAEYDALTEEQKSTLFALITDDPGASDIEADITDIKEDIEELKNSTINNRLHRYVTAAEQSETFPAIVYSDFYPTEGATNYIERNVRSEFDVYSTVIAINGIEIPTDGTNVSIDKIDLSKTDNNLEYVEYLAGYNSETELILYSRLYYKTGAGIVGRTIPAKSFKCIVATTSGLNARINHVVTGYNQFSYDMSTFLLQLSGYGQSLHKSDYILDGNNALFQVMTAPNDNGVVTLLPIRANLDKKYQHYVHFEVTNYKLPFFGTFTFSATLSYISTRTGLSSFSNFVEDFWGVFTTDDLFTKVPVSGTVIMTPEDGSFKYSQILSHIKPCLDGTDKGVHLRVNDILDGSQIGDIAIWQNISTDILTSFECTSIEI